MDEINKRMKDFLEIFPKVEKAVPLTKEELCEKLSLIIAPRIEEIDLDKEVFVSNYIYISQKIIADLCEINERLQYLKQLDASIPAEKDYEHRKLRYFANLNKQARDEIIQFLSTGLLDYLIEHKSVNYVTRQDDKLLNLMLQSCYEYGFFKKYYDPNYDFSTEAKIRFIPGVKLENFIDVINSYIKLKNENFNAYQVEISRIVVENNVLDYLCERIEVHNIMKRRLEVFNTLKILYAEKKWQSFISLAILQIEGLFYDCCNVLKNNELSGSAGTLVEKVDKSFRDNHILMLSVYPYYMFEICEDNLTDKTYFNKVYKEAVELAAYLCKQYKLTEKNIIGHYEGYQKKIASNHGDPRHWFSKHGKSMATFRADVKKELAQGASTSKPSTGGKKLYRVQIGAYSVKKNADKQLEKAKKAGFKDAFVKYE